MSKSMPQQIVEVVDGQPGADSVVLGTDLDHKRLLTVVLVADVSDDLLEQVLQGHEAGGATILVCDDRDVRPGPHLDEQLLRRLGLGNEVRLPSKVRDGLVDTAVHYRLQQVFRIEHSPDVVDRRVVDGDARESGLSR